MRIKLIDSTQESVNHVTIVEKPFWKEAPTLIQFENNWFNYTGNDGESFEYEIVPKYLIEVLTK